MGLVLLTFVTKSNGELLPHLFTLTVIKTAVIFCNAFPALLRTDVISHYALMVSGLSSRNNILPATARKSLHHYIMYKIKEINIIYEL